MMCIPTTVLTFLFSTHTHTTHTHQHGVAGIFGPGTRITDACEQVIAAIEKK